MSQSGKKVSKKEKCFIALGAVFGAPILLLVILGVIFNLSGDTDDTTASSPSNGTYSSNPLLSEMAGLLPNLARIQPIGYSWVKCYDYNTIEGGRRLEKVECARSGYQFLLIDINVTTSQDDVSLYSTRWNVVESNFIEHEEVGSDKVVRRGDCQSVLEVTPEERFNSCILRFELPYEIASNRPQLVYEFLGGFSYNSDVINWRIPQAVFSES